MDLKDFVADALVQIQHGVQGAIETLAASPKTSGAINPAWGDDHTAIDASLKQNVEFDIAVTVTNKIGGSGKGGLKIMVVEAGAEASKSHETSTISRIKFSIPIIPATTIVQPAPVKPWPKPAHPSVA